MPLYTTRLTRANSQGVENFFPGPMAGSSKIVNFRGLAITFAFLGRLRSFLYSFSSTLFGPPAKTLAREFYTGQNLTISGFFRGSDWAKNHIAMIFTQLSLVINTIKNCEL